MPLCWNSVARLKHVTAIDNCVANWPLLFHSENWAESRSYLRCICRYDRGCSPRFISIPAVSHLLCDQMIRIVVSRLFFQRCTSMTDYLTVDSFKVVIYLLLDNNCTFKTHRCTLQYVLHVCIYRVSHWCGFLACYVV